MRCGRAGGRFGEHHSSWIAERNGNSIVMGESARTSERSIDPADASDRFEVGLVRHPSQRPPQQTVVHEIGIRLNRRP